MSDASEPLGPRPRLTADFVARVYRACDPAGREEVSAEKARAVAFAFVPVLPAASVARLFPAEGCVSRGQFVGAVMEALPLSGSAAEAASTYDRFIRHAAPDPAFAEVKREPGLAALAAGVTGAAPEDATEMAGAVLDSLGVCSELTEDDWRRLHVDALGAAVSNAAARRFVEHRRQSGLHVARAAQ